MLSRLATHACAAAALVYAYRAASSARGWLEVPYRHDVPAALPMLSIIVPARNEERSIERCVHSLLAQSGIEFEVIVVDDRSTDATPEILARLAAGDARLRIVNGADLPPGWVGKPWALHQGVRSARGEWLLFTDADSRHEPHASASALAYALEHKIDALTLATGQEFGTFWEAAALPSILGLILLICGPLAAINDPAQTDHALANGQYILIARHAYAALGGHATLRGCIAEDLELARLIKRDGRFRLILASGESLATVRMYHSLGEIWDGFTKNVYLGANGDVRALAVGTLCCLAISVLPPLLAAQAVLRKHYLQALEALACSAATIGTAAWAIGQAKQRRRLALWQPLGTALFAAITVNSTVRVLSGRGVEWRGRRYSGRPSPRRGSIDHYAQ